MTAPDRIRIVGDLAYITLTKARLRRTETERDTEGEEYAVPVNPDGPEAADRIEALEATLAAMTAGREKWVDRCEAWSERAMSELLEHIKTKARLAKAVEALREIADEASVTVHTGKNGINFKRMYEGWRKIATARIDRARATLAEIGGA